MTGPCWKIFLLLILLSISVKAQVSIQHDNKLTSLQLDTADRIIVIDEKGSFHKLNKFRLEQINDYKPIVKAPQYELWQDQLKQNLEDQFSLFPLPFTARSLASLEKKILLGGTDGLWVFEQGEIKKFYVPGIEFPNEIILVRSYDQYVGLLSSENDLFIYDTFHQTLNYIASKVEDFIMDRWHSIFYIKGNSLFNNISLVNNKPPELKIIEIRNTKGTLLYEPYKTDLSTSALSIKCEVEYSPVMNFLELEYSLNDSAWKKIGYPNMITITGLSAGNNELRFRSTTEKGMIGLSKLIGIKVEDASLGKFWPWLFGVLGVLFLINLLSQYRLKNNLRAIESDRERMKLQLEIAQEKQRLGQVQMNPHFLFNSLNSISGLIALKENKKARAQLNKFAQMMRQVLDASMNDWVTIEKELSFLDDYLSLEQLIRNNKFEYKIDSDIQTGTYIPPMILQPFLENAIIHGIKHKEGKGLVQLRLKDLETTIEVVIEDDGIGRKAASKYKREGHSSSALNIIEQRLEVLNRWSDNEIDYEDLMDAGGQGRGTRVILHLPKRKI